MLLSGRMDWSGITKFPGHNHNYVKTIVFVYLRLKNHPLKNKKYLKNFIKLDAFLCQIQIYS